jgi:hypothetical protein
MMRMKDKRTEQKNMMKMRRMVRSNTMMSCSLLLGEEADKNRHQSCPYPSR